MAHCSALWEDPLLEIPSRHSHVPHLLSSPFLVQKIYVCREAVSANLIALPCSHQRVGWDCPVKSTDFLWFVSRPSKYAFNLLGPGQIDQVSMISLQSNPFSWKRICEWQLYIFLKTNLWLTTFHWPEKPWKRCRDEICGKIGLTFGFNFPRRRLNCWR